MNRQNICYLFFVFFVLTIRAQTIEGRVKDNFGEPLPRANVLVKPFKQGSEISEFFIADDNGNFRYKLKKKYDSVVFFEVNVLNYEKRIDSIDFAVFKDVYQIDFVLTPKITTLEEVVIAKRKKFNIKNDTVVFNPEAYKDGTERKVEDLLKKLPGLDVAENGKLKYRGKTVASVQLDGDDLFGYNYTIGTKNISIDMVDQIEAIENYSKNPLLKGIENSDNVALNLKLKKGKVDYSGTSDLGYGYGDTSSYDISANILGIAKSFKSFGTFSFNNIGVNHTPFDYFSSSVSLEDIENEYLYAQKIIEDTPINSILGNSRTRINNEWFGSYNFVYRFSPKFSLKSNLYYVNDEFFRQELFENDFLLGTEQIAYTDKTEIIKKPENKRLDLKFTYNVSKTSLLEVESSVQEESVSSSNSFTRNLESTSVTTLNTKNFFWKNKLEYTNKLSESTALQFKSLYSKNNLPQDFKTVGNFLSNEDVINSYTQLSEYRKEAFQNNIVFLGNRKRFKYVFNSGIDHFVSPFKSSISENDLIISDFQNDYNYKKTTYFTQFSSVYNIKKWITETSVGMNYLFQRLDNSINGEKLEKKAFFPTITLKTTYKLNDVSKLQFISGYEQKTPEENFLFGNGIITENRSIISNEVSLDLQKNQKYSLTYRLNDLFKNIDVSLLTAYTNRKNTYLSDIDVNPNFTGITYFQSPITLENYSFIFTVQRYIRFLKSTIKHSSQFNIADFKNIVNQSSFRDGESQSYSGNVFAKTAFRIPINFENSLTYNITSFVVDGLPSNTNYRIKNSFKTIVKPGKEWLFTFVYDYFKPDTTSSADFSFLDFEVKYNPKDVKWISGRLIGKNLLDNRVFEQVENSDFSTTLYQSNLIPRYFMLSVDVSF